MRAHRPAVRLPVSDGLRKDTLYNTPHPVEGAVKITTDWSARSSESVLPADYTLRIGDAALQQVTEPTNTFYLKFPSRAYDLLVYNSPTGFTVSGNTATIALLADGTLKPLPGYLFSASQSLSVQQDDMLRTTVKMQQRIRQLTLVLKLKAGDEARFESVTATLSGIASTIDLRTGALSAIGNELLAPSFALSTDAEDGLPRLTATVRLLGIVPDTSQRLLVTVTMNDGTTHPIESDLTARLKNFSQSVEPLVLGADFELPVEMGASGSINDWVPGLDDGQGNIEAN